MNTLDASCFSRAMFRLWACFQKIVIGHVPHDDDADEEAEELHVNSVFPDVASSGAYGHFISR